MDVGASSSSKGNIANSNPNNRSAKSTSKTNEARLRTVANLIQTTSKSQSKSNPKKYQAKTYKAMFDKADEVVARLEEKYNKANTLKSYLASIVAFYRDNYPDELTKPTSGARSSVSSRAVAKYRLHMTQWADKSQRAIEENVLSPKQSKVWLTWQEITETRDKILAAATSENRDPTFAEYQDYLILSLYILQVPIRSNYSPMRVVTPSERKKLRVDRENNDMNYLIWSYETKDPKFILNRYKTRNRWGSLTIECTEQLNTVLTTWFSVYNKQRRWLLVKLSSVSAKKTTATMKTEPMSEKDLSERIRVIFKKYAGKSAGINVIRHSFINTLSNELLSIRRRKEIAKLMQHSFHTQLEYMKII